MTACRSCVLSVTEHVLSCAVRVLAVEQKLEHPWNRVHLENLTVSNLIKNLHPLVESNSQEFATGTYPDTQCATSHAF
jgi:hypothetical protein